MNSIHYPKWTGLFFFRTTTLPAALVLAATGLVAAQTTESFDKLPAGEPPAGWTVGVTGTGSSKWTVEKDESAPSQPNALKQSAQATFPICLRNETSVKDGFVEVKYKAISGEKDQVGGVIWRAKDADNYYIARANALEDNVTIYRVVNGKRSSFKNTETKVTPAEWHTLRVDFSGSQFTVSLDGKKVIESADETFKDAGKVGLWTKADSVTLFDDFSFGSR